MCVCEERGGMCVHGVHVRRGRYMCEESAWDRRTLTWQSRPQGGPRHQWLHTPPEAVLIVLDPN